MRVSMGKRKSADAAADGAKGGAGAKPAGRPGRRRKDDIELEEEGAKGPELVLSVPGALKQWLVDDWRAITHEGRLHVVPSAPTVRQLVEDYTEVRALRACACPAGTGSSWPARPGPASSR